ncbi:MAG: VapC toxin family PIN domain ribonuclease [Saprospirales bacterium]|nr:VapC toxin family PIN domain ribonuclease [Saprospirales bacterium]
MNGDFIWDTNIVIALFKNDEKVISKLKKANQICLPSIVLGELYYGANNSIKKVENTLKINTLANVVNVLHCDKETASFYGAIKYNLKKAGTPIPENDIWIAAVAMQKGLTLVSRDRHFESIPGLSLESW